MPRKRKRSISPPKGIAGSSGSGGGGLPGIGGTDRESLSSIPQGIASVSGSYIRTHSHEPETMASPRHRHPPHSPTSYYQPVYEEQHTSQSYSPPNSSAYHSHPQSFYHHTDPNPYQNSPDHESHLAHQAAYSTQEQLPPNPHAPSHYNFANRAYAHQRDSGFNTFRVNPGPVPGAVTGNANSVPPLPSTGPSLHSPPPVLVPPSGHQHQHQHQRQDEDSLHFRHRSYSHSQPAVSTSNSVPAPYARLSPPPAPLRDAMARDEFQKVNRNGSRRSRRDRIHNGNESPLTSSSDDDVPYNPATAGGRSRVMVKYLIMKAKYRYVLDEGALLRDELESLKREEHDQWKLKEVGVDEIIRSFGSDSDRLIHEGDRQFQQYLLDRDHDSADWDIDMLRDLDRERHAFREREREEPDRDRDRDRGGYAASANHDDRGRIQPVYIDNRVRDEDLDLTSPISMNTRLSLPGSGSRLEERNNNHQGGGSSSRSRYEHEPRHESGLDSRSFHYPPHPYRRTPPPLLPPTSLSSDRLDREVRPEPFMHHPSASPAPAQLQSSSRVDNEDSQYVQPRRGSIIDNIEHRREYGQKQGGEPDVEYERYLSPQQHRRRSLDNIHGSSGRVSPLPSQRQERQGDYQSPPLLPHLQQPQQSLQQSVHSYRDRESESTEIPDRRRIQREEDNLLRDQGEHAEQSKRYLPYQHMHRSVSSISARGLDDDHRGALDDEDRVRPIRTRMDGQSPRPPSSEFDSNQASISVSPHAPGSDSKVSTTTRHRSIQQELNREQGLDAPRHERERLFPAGSDREGGYEKGMVMDATAPTTTTNQDATDDVQQYPSSSPVQSRVQIIHPQARAGRSSPSPVPHTQTQAQGQTEIEPAATAARTQEEQGKDQSRTSSVIPPLSSLHSSPHSNSTAGSKSAKSPKILSLAPLQTQDNTVQEPPVSSSSNPSSVRQSPPRDFHYSARTSPSHNSHSNSGSPPRVNPASHDLLQKALRNPPTSQTRHSRYAYAYYPGAGEGNGEDGVDVDTIRNSGSLTKGPTATASASANVGSDGNGSPMPSSEEHAGSKKDRGTITKGGATSGARDAMDVD